MLPARRSAALVVAAGRCRFERSVCSTTKSSPGWTDRLRLIVRAAHSSRENCSWEKSTPAPTPEGATREQLEAGMAAAFEQMGAAHEQPDTTRHPGMHKTKTIDYIILLSGNAKLLLDDDEVLLQPFDVVVQRGTNHAWVVDGTESALFIAVLIDSEIVE